MKRAQMKGYAALAALMLSPLAVAQAEPLAPSAPAALPITLDIVVGGNQAVIGIDAGALPLARDAELLLSFDDAENLCAETLGASVALVNPLDPAFRARLPTGALVPLALPVMIRIEPPASAVCPGDPTPGALAFNDTVRAEVHTHLLPFTVDSPLRLYKAPLGGMFFDLTDAVLPGSVRTGGRTGGFSEFIVVIDLRPVAETIEAKYDFLAARLVNPAIAPGVVPQLQSDLAASRSAFDAADRAAAIAALDAFVQRIDAANAAVIQIPNRWRAQRDLDNIAGDLKGEAASLRFHLGRL